MHPQYIPFSINGTAASGVLAAGTACVGRVGPDDFGGAITVVGAMIAAKSGTCTVSVVDLGSTGTVVAGTVVTLTYAAADNTPLGTTLATTYSLDPGDYWGLEIGAGTVIYPFNGMIQVLPGK